MLSSTINTSPGKDLDGGRRDRRLRRSRGTPTVAALTTTSAASTTTPSDRVREALRAPAVDAVDQALTRWEPAGEGGAPFTAPPLARGLSRHLLAPASRSARPGTRRRGGRSRTFGGCSTGGPGPRGVIRDAVESSRQGRSTGRTSSGVLLSSLSRPACDWVRYEGRTHVHASARRGRALESDDPNATGRCGSRQQMDTDRRPGGATRRFTGRLAPPRQREHDTPLARSYCERRQSHRHETNGAWAATSGGVGCALDEPLGG